MATTLASLVVRVGADVSGVTAGMNTLQKRSRKLKKQFGTVRDSTIRWQSALGVLAGATGLALAGQKVFELGASIEETASKFNTVFGPSVEGAQQFLDDFAATAGLTNTEGQEVLATTGAIAQGMGLSQKASAGFSQEVVKLAGDLTSFNDVPIADTSRAIQSALTGERESLKRLGIVILETDVQKRALAMTGKESAKALTQEEKAHATLALITERAGVAVGDLARTKDSAANRARKLRADVLNLRNSFATALQPALGVVLNELVKVSGSEGIAGLSAKIKESSPIIAAWATFAVESFKTVAMAIAAPVRIAFNLGQVIGKVLVAAVQTMKGDLDGARETLGSVVGDFGDMRDSITNVITGFDNMRVASGAAFQTMATEAAEAIGTGAGGGRGVSGALKIANAAFREMAAQLPTVTANVQLFASAEQALGLAANAAASAQERLNSALSKAQGFLGGLGALTGVLGFALPGIGQIGGLLSAATSFSGLFAHGGHIPSGGWGIVGERGPEIVQGPAQVTPMGGGSGRIEVVYPAERSPTDFKRDPQITRAWMAVIRELEANGFRAAT